MKFEAGIHGIDWDKAMEESEKKDGKQKGQPANGPASEDEDESSALLFKDPAEYEKMPLAKRQALTQKMIQKWRQVAADSVFEKVTKGILQK